MLHLRNQGTGIIIDQCITPVGKELRRLGSLSFLLLMCSMCSALYPCGKLTEVVHEVYDRIHILWQGSRSAKFLCVCQYYTIDLIKDKYLCKIYLLLMFSH